MTITREKLRKAWHSRPETFPVRVAYARLLTGFAGTPKPLKVLLASDGASFTNEQQFAPILRHAALLRDRFGVVVQLRRVEEALNHADLSHFDIVGLKLSFVVSAEKAVNIAKEFRRRIGEHGTRFIYFDGDDDLNVQWPGVLGLVDCYVKNHAFADINAYAARYIGKTNLTDYVAKKYGTSFAEDIIPESGGADISLAPKIHVGWNIGLGDPVFDLIHRTSKIAAVERDCDVVCRASFPPGHLLFQLRDVATQTLESMSGRFRVLAPRDRVSFEDYWREMIRSRICVSPFGHGEICWRDFETIIAGALLIKPDMSHLTTAPNIFLPGITYVPVRWDYSDLEEKCSYFLQHETEREKIVAQARAVLMDALRPEWFLGRFSELLTRVGLG